MKNRPKLNLLSVSTVELAMLEITQAIETLHGIDISIEFNTTLQIKEKYLFHEKIDILISTQELIGQLDRKSVV